MAKDKDKKKDETQEIQEAQSCCYSVVDTCGCVVGWYCCESPDMSSCRFETSC